MDSIGFGELRAGGRRAGAGGVRADPFLRGPVQDRHRARGTAPGPESPPVRVHATYVTYVRALSTSVPMYATYAWISASWTSWTHITRLHAHHPSACMHSTRLRAHHPPACTPPVCMHTTRLRVHHPSACTPLDCPRITRLHAHHPPARLHARLHAHHTPGAACMHITRLHAHHTSACTPPARMHPACLHAHRPFACTPRVCMHSVHVYAHWACVCTLGTSVRTCGPSARLAGHGRVHAHWTGHVRARCWGIAFEGMGASDMRSSSVRPNRPAASVASEAECACAVIQPPRGIPGVRVLLRNELKTEVK